MAGYRIANYDRMKYPSLPGEAIQPHHAGFNVDRQLALVRAVLIQPRAILLVQSLDVVDEPVVQEAQRIAHVHGLAVLQPVGGLMELRQQTLVLRAVLGQRGKAGLLHQLLFAPEVHARELDQPVQQLASLFATATAHHRQPKFVHCIHQDAVLIVHGSYADGAGVVPGQKGHMSLRESLRLSAQAMLTAQVAAMGVHKWRFKRSSSVLNRDSAANSAPPLSLRRRAVTGSTLRLTEASSSPKPAPEVFHHTFPEIPRLSTLSLVSDVWRWGYREGRLLKLEAKVGPLNFPVAKGAFQMHSSLTRRRCLGILAEIGGLSQVESNLFINQIFDMRCTRGMAH